MPQESVQSQTKLQMFQFWTTPIKTDHLVDYFDLTEITLHKTSDELIENMNQLMHKHLRKGYWEKDTDNPSYDFKLLFAVKHIDCYNLHWFFNKNKLNQDPHRQSRWGLLSVFGFSSVCLSVCLSVTFLVPFYKTANYGRIWIFKVSMEACWQNTSIYHVEIFKNQKLN